MRLVMCAAAVLLACGSALAGPPRGPLPEGRELDPVARDYYHGERPVPPAERVSPPREQKTSGTVWLVQVGCEAVEAILNEVALPLGPCRTKGM